MNVRILRDNRALIPLALFVSFTVMPLQSALGQVPAIVHVDGANGSASPAGLGDDWGSGHAYKFLQDALTRADTLLALSTPPSEVQIWVLGGTTPVIYRPDQSFANQSGTNSPNATFTMRVKVKLYGGFTVERDRGLGPVSRVPDH